MFDSWLTDSAGGTLCSLLSLRFPRADGLTCLGLEVIDAFGFGQMCLVFGAETFEEGEWRLMGSGGLGPVLLTPYKRTDCFSFLPLTEAAPAGRGSDPSWGPSRLGAPSFPRGHSWGLGERSSRSKAQAWMRVLLAWGPEPVLVTLQVPAPCQLGHWLSHPGQPP